MKTKSKTSAFIQQLKDLTLSTEDSIAKAVALEAYDPESKENTLNFFKDLLQHGCISGMVSSLIYYYQTEAFFDKHYEEIMQLKIEFEQSTGQPMQIPYELKNYLSWFAFEQTAYQIFTKAGLKK